MIYDGDTNMKADFLPTEGINNLYKTGNIYLAGQPSIEALEGIKEMGVKKIFNLRSDGEADFSAIEQKIKELGMEYIFLPIMKDGALNPEACKVLNDQVTDDGTSFVHCGSANRVGGWLISFLVSKKGLDFEEAVSIAQNSGLKSVEFIEQVQNMLDD